MTDSKHSFSQCRALLVDDSPVNQELMASLLQHMGCTVTLAKNGREAVTKLVEQGFDVVFMDVQMPVIDGMAATRIIRQHESAVGKHTPIVAVTAGMDRETCLEAGMDDHLVKPIRGQELEAALQRASCANQ